MLTRRSKVALLITMALLGNFTQAQDKLKSWPISAQYSRDLADSNGLIKIARVDTRWVDNNHLAYKSSDKWQIIELPSGKVTEAAKEPVAVPNQGRQNPNNRRRNPGRGGQFDESLSTDGKTRAFYKDGNVWFSREDGQPIAVTTDGSISNRVKYGTGSWVYGEELSQTEALGLNPEGTKLWFYRFDESKVIDNFVVFNQNTPHPRFEAQAYPKPGSDNPIVDLYISHLDSKAPLKIKVRPGDFDNGQGHYIYDIQWSPDAKDLYFRRTDRKQKIMEFCSANSTTGEVRVIVHEEWPKSFVENKLNVWLLDNINGIEKRPELKGKMLWESQRNGFINLYLVDLKTGETKPVTNNQFDETRVVRIDLASGLIFYMGRGMKNPYNDQLYSVSLDGTKNTLATDGSFDHSVSLSPDGKYAIDTAQTCETPPTIRLISMTGKVIKVLAESDSGPFTKAGYQLPERVAFTSADGKTTIHGVLHKPRNFDPTRKYPLIVDVYGGPIDAHNSGFSESFRPYDADTGYGVLKASFDNRGTGGRGKVFSDPLYRNMGITEMDDQAEGVKALIKKGFVDTDKVGMTGTSYGGYSSIMCLLRHPEVFKAAVACSAPTEWHNYDTIYTERYMDLSEDNKSGYEAGSAMTYADKLTGWLMVYYGTADENVHPCNSLQLLSKLRRLGKTVEVQVGTDMGHSAIDDRRAMEFFIERLNISRG